MTNRYSGVARNPNAYVPPAARKSQGGFAAAAARGQAASTPKSNGRATPTGPANVTPTQPATSAAAQTTPASAEAKTAPAAQPAATTTTLAAPSMAASVSSNATLSNPPEGGLAPPAPPTRSTSDRATDLLVPATTIAPAGQTPSSVPDKPTVASDAVASAAMNKTESKVSVTNISPRLASRCLTDQDGPGVLESFRQFVGTERERVEAKKQSIQKSEREKQLAELKKFQHNFKVSLRVTFTVF